MRWAFWGTVRAPGVYVMRMIVIEAPTWFYARARAMIELGTDRVGFAEARHFTPEIILRWTGHDAGRVPTLRLVEGEPYLPKVQQVA